MSARIRILQRGAQREFVVSSRREPGREAGIGDRHM
jgi:hypothetical protein